MLHRSLMHMVSNTTMTMFLEVAIESQNAHITIVAHVINLYLITIFVNLRLSLVSN